MESVIVGVVVLASLSLVTLSTLTALGARRRGRGLAVAILTGVFFPITWTVWYLRDEHPYQRAVHRS